MVLMLDPQLAAKPLGQQRPGVLRGRQDVLMDVSSRFTQRGRVEHDDHPSSVRG
jgi:hypothetical protein